MGSSITPPSPKVYSRVFLPALAEAVIAGTWSNAINSAYWFNNNFYNTSATQNDEFTMTVALSAGTYTLRSYYTKSAGNGIATYKIDGTNIGTLNQTGGTNGITDITGIIIPNSAIHTFSVSCVSKTGTNYQLQCQAFEFIQTA
jgi:hypothetical protein